MKAYRKWVLSLGIAAVTPGLVMAGPFSIFNKNSSQPARPAALDNQKLTEQVASNLRAAKLTGFDIDIEVRDGVCILLGKIKDAEQKQRASLMASKVPGVSRIDNRLELLSGNPVTLANHKLGPAPRMPQQVSQIQTAPPQQKRKVNLAGFFSRDQKRSAGNEQQVANRIAGAIGQSGVRGHSIDLKYKQGVAILSGMCRSPQDVSRITQVVASVPGVRQVDNRLEVPGMRRSAAPFGPMPRPAAPGGKLSNQQVAEQVAQALAANHLGGLDIEVRFNSGVCTLGGSVKHPQQAAWASHVCQQVPGVERVENKLDFAAASPIQPASFQQPGGMPPGMMPQGMRPGMMPQGMRPGMMPPGMRPGMPQGMPQPSLAQIQQMQMASFQGAQVGTPPMPGPARGHGGAGPSHLAYDLPNLPNYAWPTYASYPNSAQISYPTEYSASAWPYIGPFYPYPQVPMGWRDVRLTWDDGHWAIAFNSRTDKWFWFLSPKNW